MVTEDDYIFFGISLQICITKKA